MEYRALGSTQTQVSALALGTMTWGEQNSASEAYVQLDYALSRGINFIDTAEMYPVPPRENTYGQTEEIIGNWLAKRHTREQIILASKIAGPRSGFDYMGRSGSAFSAANLEQALNQSLKRLKTDYIDLYQLHWPERATNYFGKLGYDANNEHPFTLFTEILETLGQFVQIGKIRFIGLSNETAWGVMTALAAAKGQHERRVVSIQNPYSLLNRSFEVGLAEVAHREQVGLLAYSPLAFGVLSGKYLGNQKPADGRLTQYPYFTRYTNEAGQSATKAYFKLAEKFNIPLSHMALAYVTSRPFTTSTIIGATTIEQLKHNIDSIEVNLDDDLIEAIESIHQIYPYPCP